MTQHSISAPKTSPVKAYAVRVIAAACWGMNAVLGELAVGEILPMQLVTLRWIAVVAVVLPFAWKPVINDWPELRPRLHYLMLMGASLNLFSVLFYSAAHSTSAINIGILQGTIPMLIVFGGSLIYKNAVTALQLLGILVTLSGVAVVASAGSSEQLLSLAFKPGDLLMLLACLVYAAYALGLSNKPAVSASAFFAVMVICSLLVSLPFLGWEMLTQRMQWPTTTGLAIAVVAGLFTSLLAQMLFIQGVAAIGPGRAGVFVNLVPVVAALLAVLLLKEIFQWFHAVALVLVLGGIWLSERGTG